MPKIQVLTLHDITVLQPNGPLLNETEVDEFRTKAKEVLEQGRKKLVIDLADVNLLSSSGVGALVNLRASCTHAGGKIKLCNMGWTVRKVLDVTKLTNVFEIEENRDDAIKSLS